MIETVELLFCVRACMPASLILEACNPKSPKWKEAVMVLEAAEAAIMMGLHHNNYDSKLPLKILSSFSSS